MLDLLNVHFQFSALTNYGYKYYSVAIIKIKLKVEIS